jgi:hypothetical protein
MKFKIFLITTFSFLIFFACNSKHSNDSLTAQDSTKVSILIDKKSPQAVMQTDFKIYSSHKEVPDFIKSELLRVIWPDTLRMYDFHENHRFPTTDSGRRFNIFGINNSFAFIIYDRLACIGGNKKIIIFVLNNQKAKAIWAANILNSLGYTQNIDNVRSTFQNAMLMNCPLDKNYSLF